MERLVQSQRCSNSFILYALLPNKKQSTYQRFFTILQQNAETRNLHLRPRTIFTDFEKAVQNAVRHVFDCELKGCLFHYRQAVWRNVQKCGLQSAFANNLDVNLFVRRASALPLLRPEDIEDFWFNALEAANMADPSISKLADYVTEQWVEGEDRNMWNHFDTLGPRTTNHVEGWHARINKMTTNHPNI
ncbi:uncharacterized protein LOC125378113 [Haliotis rufescens]|uniref:uncharacterized protein LOC125378113 n=1 Tax=Haliotis rufescens TaxID=6454 RepID=UPI00201EDF59|nr:uncharacterized protein LOC125378113 [Haliotis rufescens]